MPLTDAGRSRLSRLAKAQQRDRRGRFSPYCRDRHGRFACKRDAWLHKWSRVRREEGVATWAEVGIELSYEGHQHLYDAVQNHQFEQETDEERLRRYEADHIRESESQLRAEGIRDPRAWDRAMQEVAQQINDWARQFGVAVQEAAEAFRRLGDAITNAFSRNAQRPWDDDIQMMGGNRITSAYRTYATSTSLQDNLSHVRREMQHYHDAWRNAGSAAVYINDSYVGAGTASYSFTADTTAWQTAPYYQYPPGYSSNTATRTGYIGYSQEVPHHVADATLAHSEVIDATHYEEMVEQRIRQLQQHVESDERSTYGDIVPNGIWYAWVQHPNGLTPNDDATDWHRQDSVQIGVGHVGTEEMSVAERHWQRWANQGVPVSVQRGRPRVPTPGEVAQAEATERRNAVRAERRAYETLERHVREIEQQRDREEAKRRAEELLHEHLTEEQRDDWERANRFEVIVGDRTYKIARGFQGNVYRIDEDGNEVERFCAHARAEVPEADQVLYQKLMLETAEDEFRRIANITDGSGAMLSRSGTAG